MNKAKRNNILILAFALALVPTLSFAQTSPESPAPTQIAVPQGFNGIFSCNQNGAYAMSVGALGATGGVYVPVADAAVELNTGTLVYKECVLREVVDAQRQLATAGYVQQSTNNVLTGRTTAQGTKSALFVQQQGPETAQVSNAAFQNYVQSGALNSINPALQPEVTQAIAQGYAAAMQQPNAQLTCTIPDNLSSVLSGQTNNTLGDLAALQNPACDPLGATLLANYLAMSAVNQEVQCQNNQWQWSGGFYAVTTGSGGPCEQQIVTPGSNVNSSYSTVLNSGFNQLQNANDIGQMVGALFSGLSTQILNGTAGGITGANQPVGSSPSYLQQLVSQQSQNLQGAVANTALVNLQSALQIEQGYYNEMGKIASDLEGAITQLRSSENACWQQVVSAVCTGPVSSNGTCTDSGGTQLKVATSTEFSQAVINSQITSLASTTANNLQVSQQALDLINQLIQNVSGTSPDSQALAVEQLNTLTANNELHTPADLTTAQSQEQAVANAMTTIETNTPSLWAGTDPNNNVNNNIPWNGSVGATIQVSDPGVGWCNFKNSTTIQAWENAWNI